MQWHDLIKDKVEASVLQSGFFADFCFWQILEQIQACLLGPKCSPWIHGPGGNCVTCCLLEKADFSADFLHILLDFGIPIFETPKRLRKICTKICAKQNSAHQKSALFAPKICAKMGAKVCAKICAPKICAKKTVWTFRFLEDGSQNKKKKNKNNLRQICVLVSRLKLRYGGVANERA